MSSSERPGVEPSVPPPRYVNLAAALIGTCRGTAVFQRLRHQKVFRTLWQLAVLAAVLGGLSTWGVMSRLTPELMRVGSTLKREFGGLQISEAGLRPMLEPERSRSVELPAGGRLFYYADPTARPESEQLAAQRYNVLWYPGCLLSVLNSEGRTLVSVWRPGHAGGVPQPVAAGELNELIERELEGASIRRWPEALSGRTFKVETLIHSTRSFLALGIWCAYGIYQFLQTVICVSLFVLVFRLAGVGRGPVLSGRELWVTAIYTSFPAMMVGTAFVALDLPLLSYETVYVFGFIIYLLVVLRSLEKQGADDGRA